MEAKEFKLAKEKNNDMFLRQYSLFKR